MKYLKPSELAPWHIRIVAKVMDMEHIGLDTPKAWYDWYLMRYHNDPLHCEPFIKNRLDKFNEEFALARLRGTHVNTK